MKVEPSVEAKLKSELKAIEKRQSELKKEMANLDKDIAQMGLNGQARQSSILCRICQFVQQGWRTLGLFFAASLVLIPVIIAIMINISGLLRFEYNLDGVADRTLEMMAHTINGRLTNAQTLRHDEFCVTKALSHGLKPVSLKRKAYNEFLSVLRFAFHFLHFVNMTLERSSAERELDAQTQ